MKKPITNETITGWLLTGIFLCIIALIAYNFYLNIDLNHAGSGHPEYIMKTFLDPGDEQEEEKTTAETTEETAETVEETTEEKAE